MLYLSFSFIQFSNRFSLESEIWELPVGAFLGFGVTWLSTRKLPALKFSTNQIARRQVRNNEPSSYVTPLDPRQHRKFTSFRVVSDSNAFDRLFTPPVMFASWLFIFVSMAEWKFCCVYGDEYVTTYNILRWTWRLANLCQKIEVCWNIFLRAS